MTEASNKDVKQPFIPHAIRLLAVPIILFWVIITVVVNTLAPQLEAVGEAHAAPMAPKDAPPWRR